jgi:predicted secreted protein
MSAYREIPACEPAVEISSDQCIESDESTIDFGGLSAPKYICLGANPTTGYTWMTSGDVSDYEICRGTVSAQQVQQNMGMGMGMVGVPVTHYFKLTPRASARNRNIKFVYKRSWEEDNKDLTSKTYRLLLRQ